MTVFGTDISSFQHGLSLAELPDVSFVLAKATEGTSYTDADYSGWRRQAAQRGLPFIWYHFLGSADAHAQVVHTAANIGDKTLPGMLDVEPEGSFRPTLAQVIAYADAAHEAGLNLKLVYLPRWYWQQIGSPSLTPLADRGLRLMSSAYPGGTGTAAQLYPGDGAAGWQPYGGLTPLLYQFTSQARDGGQLIDMNAFRGTAAQLATLLGTPSPSPSPTAPGGSPVGTIPASISQKWPELAGDFPPNAPFTDESALIWADGGARAAALYAQQARDAINALAARIGAAPAPAQVPIDVAALAKALAPLLQTGPTADQVALAVEAHLGAALRSES